MKRVHVVVKDGDEVNPIYTDQTEAKDEAQEEGGEVQMGALQDE